MNVHLKTKMLLVLAAPWLFLLSNAAHAVDGVILITQAKAFAGNLTPGDTPGFPVTISQSGSYRLASDLVVTTATVDGINITADSVTLDLNGFSITGPDSGSGTGISTNGVVGDTTVRNGTVAKMGVDGVFLGSLANVANVATLFNGSDGIKVSSISIVTGCKSLGNDGNGIVAGLDSIVTGNAVNLNGQVGILQDQQGSGPRGSIFKDNTVARNSGLGLDIMLHSGYGNNTIISNNGSNANPQVRGGIEIGTNICGTNTVCAVLTK